MTTLTWPILDRTAPGSLDFSFLSNTQVFTSPLTQSSQTVEMPGARWRVSFTMQSLVENDTAKLQSFMAKLRGRAGRFTLHHFGRPVPRGIASGAPLVSGAGQSGTSLVTDGWTPSLAGQLLEGDFIGVNGELKMIVQDADSNSSGMATLVFEPPLRSSPADNAVVVLTKPTAIFMLDEDVARALTRPGKFSDIAISATEAWS